MLVITLDLDKSSLDNVVYMTGGIEIQLLEICPQGRKQVRIGITAPRDIDIERGKVLMKIKRDGRNNKDKNNSSPA